MLYRSSISRLWRREYEYLGRGPLGFPVVDLAVTLLDGQYHTVDSSDMAFRKAAQSAMREGMPKCNSVLLEPIFQVKWLCPASSRRGSAASERPPWADPGIRVKSRLEKLG